jgi:hypothetical protein
MFTFIGMEQDEDDKAMDEQLRLPIFMPGLALLERRRRQNRMGIGSARTPGAPGLMFGNFGLKL